MKHWNATTLSIALFRTSDTTCEHGRYWSEDCVECDMEIETIAAAARLDRDNRHASAPASEVAS